MEYNDFVAAGVVLRDDWAHHDTCYVWPLPGGHFGLYSDSGQNIGGNCWKFWKSSNSEISGIAHYFFLLF